MTMPSIQIQEERANCVYNLLPTSFASKMAGKLSKS